jgi:hypothetical protein
MSVLKAIYEFIGVPYPRASLIGVVVLGAVLAGLAWSFLASQVAKDHQATSASPVVSTPVPSGPASTIGNDSPAVTGNGNTFNISSSDKTQK